MSRPPAYWTRPDGDTSPWAVVLKPLSRLYAAIGRYKMKSKLAWQADRPVICVGNVSMGGVGKTPFAIMLAETLKEINLAPGFLTRGYGGKARGPVLLAPSHEARDVGDEALLLARHGPVMVARDRVEGVRRISAPETPQIDAIIMDDGFQNPSLIKDCSFLLVDGETGFGNGLVFPAGPLRERPEDAMARADALVVVTPDGEAPVADEWRRLAADKPVLKAWLVPGEAEPERVVAFCGIGRPAKFYETARWAGFDLAATLDFPDHHAWTGRDTAKLLAMAREHKAQLLTTEKDFVRLPASMRSQVKTLPVRMMVDDPALLGNILSPVLRPEPDRHDA